MALLLIISTIPVVKKVSSPRLDIVAPTLNFLKLSSPETSNFKSPSSISFTTKLSMVKSVEGS